MCETESPAYMKSAASMSSWLSEVETDSMRLSSSTWRLFAVVVISNPHGPSMVGDVDPFIPLVVFSTVA